jgi:hypothetical protein
LFNNAVSTENVMYLRKRWGDDPDRCVKILKHLIVSLSIIMGFLESVEENNSMCSGFKLDTAEINVLV